MISPMLYTFDNGYSLCVCPEPAMPRDNATVMVFDPKGRLAYDTLFEAEPWTVEQNSAEIDAWIERVRSLPPWNAAIEDYPTQYGENHDCFLRFERRISQINERSA